MLNKDTKPSAVVGFGGDVVVAGASGSGSATDAKSRGFVARVSDAGVVKWQALSDKTARRYEYAAPSKDGGLVVVGASDPGLKSFGSEAGLALARVSASGKWTWSTWWQPYGDDYTTCGIVSTSKNHWVGAVYGLGGMKLPNASFLMWPVGGTKPKLATSNPAAGGVDRSQFCEAIVASYAGGVVTVTREEDTLPAGGWPIPVKETWLYALSPAKKTGRLLAKGDMQAIRDVVQTPDGSFVAVGWRDLKKNGPTLPWILKLTRQPTKKCPP